MIGKILKDLEKSMRIGIDAHAAERDGSGNCTYIRNLLLALKDVDEENDYILYVTDAGHPFFQEFTAVDRFSVRQLLVKNPFFRIPVFLAAATYRDNLDILHVQYNAPPIHKGKLVVTIHDLSFLHFPEFFSKFEAMRLKKLTRMTARKAAKIITGSRFSRDDILDAYLVDPTKVEAIPLGVSPRFQPEMDPDAAKNVLDKFGVQKPYLLFVGRLNPRKNLAALAQAFASLKQEHSLPHKLVIAGKEDFNSRELLGNMKNVSAAEDIIFTGFVLDDELPYLYNQAEIFVYMSFFEGTGLPVLEAMRSGVPVITSDTTSLKEVVGDAGISVDPQDEKEIVRSILKLVNDHRLRDQYCMKGLEWAQAFSWTATAQKTLRVYRDLIYPELFTS